MKCHRRPEPGTCTFSCTFASRSPARSSHTRLVDYDKLTT